MRRWGVGLVAVAVLAASPVLHAATVPLDASGPNGKLSGTWLQSGKTNAPVVLMIPGSGPTDRDGNSSGPVRPATLRLIAEGLAAHGIDTVRIDKRGMFGSSAAVPNANDVTIEAYAQDVHAWSDVIRQRTNARCVWFLGHSEGGLVALVAAQKPSGSCGLLLLSTFGRKFGSVLREQLNDNPANAPLLPEANRAISDLEAGRHVDAASLSPALLPLFRDDVQGFAIDEMKLDPSKLIAKVSLPVLIVQGTRDIQVSVADARLLAKADPRAELKLLPDTNHVLKTVRSDDRKSNIATYIDPALPLAPGVVESIVTFVHAHS